MIMNPVLVLIGFLVLTLGGGSLIGFWSVPGEWYEQLAKPAFNPPNWIFGPVWTVLYIMIAFAGWRLWRRNPTGSAMLLWWGQLALNFLWPLVFFTARRFDLALIVIVILLATIIGLIVSIYNRDRLVAFVMLPYALWVAFAALLNLSIFLLN